MKTNNNNTSKKAKEKEMNKKKLIKKVNPLIEIIETDLIKKIKEKENHQEI